MDWKKILILIFFSENLLMIYGYSVIGLDNKVCLPLAETARKNHNSIFQKYISSTYIVWLVFLIVTPSRTIYKNILLWCLSCHKLVWHNKILSINLSLNEIPKEATLHQCAGIVQKCLISRTFKSQRERKIAF